jgi:hypothetical protein
MKTKRDMTYIRCRNTLFFFSWKNRACISTKKKEKKRKEKKSYSERFGYVACGLIPSCSCPVAAGVREGPTNPVPTTTRTAARIHGWAGHLGRQPFIRLLCPSPHLLSGSLASAADDWPIRISKAHTQIHGGCGAGTVQQHALITKATTYGWG